MQQNNFPAPGARLCESQHATTSERSPITATCEFKAPAPFASTRVHLRLKKRNLLRINSRKFAKFV
jgi:hypothetical protein